MNWQDKGYLLSITKYNENSSIAEFYTKRNGKSLGIIFGSSSKKIKNYLFIGNKFHINYSSKSQNTIGSFSVEIEKVNTPLYLDQKEKFFCILYSMSIIRILSVENQKNINVYKTINAFFELLEKNFNIKDFIFWELELLKNFGYELKYSDYTDIINKNGETIYVSKINKNKIIPNFLINHKIIDVKKEDLINALELTGDFLKKSILIESNIPIPLSRKKFIDIINNL